MAATLIERTFEVGGVKVTITRIPAHADGGQTGVDLGGIAASLLAQGLVKGAAKAA